MEMPKLPENWFNDWNTTNTMELFVAQDGDWCRIYVVNKKTRLVYHVVDLNVRSEGYSKMYRWPACTLVDNKVYLIGDRKPDDVFICDLTSPFPKPNNYTWKKGPAMHSTKFQHHVIRYQGLIYVISNPDEFNMRKPFNRDDVVVIDPINKPVVASFEVLDTNDTAAKWEVLPDPPFANYNNHLSAYRVMSYTIYNGLFYFVFDEVRFSRKDIYQFDDGDEFEKQQHYEKIIRSKVLAFDPEVKKWLTNMGDYDPGIRWYIDLAAHCTQGGNRVVELVDPNMRCFLMDPPGTLSNLPKIPCFYTYDYSSWFPTGHSAVSPPLALIENVEPMIIPSPNELSLFLRWFQIYVCPRLSPVTGLAPLMTVLANDQYRHCHSFIVPGYHQDEEDVEHWSVCLVAFKCNSDSCLCVVATFKLLNIGSSNLFEATDLKYHVQRLTNISNPLPVRFPPKFYRIA